MFTRRIRRAEIHIWGREADAADKLQDFIMLRSVRMWP